MISRPACIKRSFVLEFSFDYRVLDCWGLRRLACSVDFSLVDEEWSIVITEAIYLFIVK